MAALKPISHIFLVLATLIFLSGCVNTRFLKKDQVLFHKNKIELDYGRMKGSESSIKKDLKSISQLQPNKKFLGLFKTRLWFYNVANRHRSTRFRYWIKDKIGEPPVFYDPLLAEKSTILMENYLHNKGFFYAQVDYVLNKKRKEKMQRLEEQGKTRKLEKMQNKQPKKAVITYEIKARDQYLINAVIFPDEENNRISRIIQRNKKDSYLKRGDPFDVSVLKDERERISNDLRDEGYYYFNKEYVYFDLDSNNTNKELDLFVKINEPEDTLDHQIFYINNIYVYTDYSVEQLKLQVDYDTTQVDEYYFIYEDLKYRPKILISAIHFRRDSMYRKIDNSRTINHLSNLGVFKYVNVKFKKNKERKGNYLDCFIYLSPSKKQEVGVEFEANNNTDYNLGVVLTLSYRNKNIFRGTELFQFSVSGGFESNLERGGNFFNTVDLTAKFDLFFNQFITPFKLKRISKNARPRTRISFRNQFLKRIDYYTTNSVSFSFGYDWREVKTRRHIFNPLVFDYVRIYDETQDFRDIVDRSPSLKNSFTQQLIIGMEYNFIWTNQSTARRPSFFYYIGKASTAGNLLDGISALINLKRGNATRPYEAFGVPYSQHFIVDSDIRNYLNFRGENKLVSRVFAGIGVPYGNSESLVYIKQFFAGGANSMRGWPIRALGPGSYNFRESVSEQESNFFFDQTGEVQLEGNAEYRFDIFKFFKGALFTDVGNIWLLRKDTSRPGAEIDLRRMWKEFAIGTGFGLRFDFSYFVLRFDVGLKIREPATGKERWPIRNFDLGDKSWRRENVRFNLAIGYPF